MLPGEHLSEGGRGTHNNQTGGSMSLSSVQDIRSVCDPDTEGNTVQADLICTQPLPAAAPATESAADAAVLQTDLQKCRQCGPTLPDSGLTPVSSSQSGVQSSRASERRGRKRSGVAGPHQTAATSTDRCFDLLLACLSCRCSTLLLGLTEACVSCLHALCSGCCRGCARCCSAVQEVPVEELSCHTHCHSVLFESCCEPTECLEFCLDCCDICHRT